MKQINPGKYRHKIKILQRVNGKDQYGEPTSEWIPFKQNIWASKDPLLGNEFFTALTTENKVEVKFNTRYIPGIMSEMRVQHGPEVYEILGPPVNVKSLNVELLLYCKLVK